MGSTVLLFFKQTSFCLKQPSGYLMNWPGSIYFPLSVGFREEKEVLPLVQFSILSVT